MGSRKRGEIMVFDHCPPYPASIINEVFLFLKNWNILIFWLRSLFLEPMFIYIYLVKSLPTLIILFQDSTGHRMIFHKDYEMDCFQYMRFLESKHTFSSEMLQGKDFSLRKRRCSFDWMVQVSSEYNFAPVLFHHFPFLFYQFLNFHLLFH